MYVVVSKHMLPLKVNKPINFENFLVSPSSTKVDTVVWFQDFNEPHDKTILHPSVHARHSRSRICKRQIPD